MEEKLSLSVYNGRPFGGTGILVRNQMSKFVVPVSTPYPPSRLLPSPTFPSRGGTPNKGSGSALSVRSAADKRLLLHGTLKNRAIGV